MNYTELADLWYEIMNLEAALGKAQRRQQESDALAQPGYVGSNYAGVLLIGMNPGAGGRSVNETPANERLYDAFDAMKRAESDNRLNAFGELSQAYENAIPTWKLYRNLVGHLLEQMKLDLDQIAWLNLVPWRTAKSSEAAKLVPGVWKYHTKPQLEILQPKCIILLGLGTGEAFRENYAGEMQNLHVIRRVNGDGYLAEQTKSAIKLLEPWPNT